MAAYPFYNLMLCVIGSDRKANSVYSNQPAP